MSELSEGDVVTIGAEWFRVGIKAQADNVVAHRLIPMNDKEIEQHKAAHGEVLVEYKGPISP